MPVSFVDLAVRPPAPAELRRFAERLGTPALLDTEGRLYRGSGLGYLRMDDAEMLDRLISDPRLLRLPLVRFGSAVTVGVDEGAWKSWLRS